VNRIDVVPGRVVAPPERARFGRTPTFESENLRVGETHMDGRSASPWHHHGRRTVYAYVVAGEIILEFGPRGNERVRAVAGDFFRIPAGLVHRDVNPAATVCAVVNLMLGDGPATIDVGGPDA
jgi:uncharacterized RmlC-like cupin family protein